MLARAALLAFLALGAALHDGAREYCRGPIQFSNDGIIRANDTALEFQLENVAFSRIKTPTTTATREETTIKEMQNAIQKFRRLLNNTILPIRE